MILGDAHTFSLIFDNLKVLLSQLVFIQTFSNSVNGKCVLSCDGVHFVITYTFLLGPSPFRNFEMAIKEQFFRSEEDRRNLEAKARYQQTTQITYTSEHEN
jgi:hypothetical protein